MKLVTKVFASMLLLAMTSGCSSTGSSSSATPVQTAASHFDTNALPGWSTEFDREAGLFKCNPPECKDFALAAYGITPLSPGEEILFKSDSPKSREFLASQIKQTFSAFGGGMTAIGEPVYANYSGVPAVEQAVGGVDAKGAPLDPGYMIIIADKGKGHIIMGITKTPAEATRSARQVASAWHPTGI